jgi:tetratricopeptide (TPR) repeat protein
MKNKKRKVPVKAAEKNGDRLRSPRAKDAPWDSVPCHLAVAAGALIVLLAVYQRALDGPFVFDDNYLPFRDVNIGARSFRAWVIGVRPLLMTSFWLNYHFWRLEPYPYHLFNLIFHFLNGVLVYLFARKLLDLGQSTVSLPRFTREALSVFAGGLFLLHPLQTESVSYIASRSETLSVLFFFSAFALFLYRRSQAISWPVTAGILALFFAGVSTKEHTAVLPALLLVTDYYWNPGFSFQGIRRNWRLYLPIAAGGAIGLAAVFRVLRHADTAGFGVKNLPWYQYFFTECRVIWVYIRLFLVPAGQTIDYDYPISRTLLDHGALFGLAALVLVAAAAFYYRRRYPLASYGVVVFLILLAPTSSFVPIVDPIAEHRVYFPIIGLIFVLLEFLRRWKIGRPALMAVLGAVLAAAGALCYHRNGVWTSSVALWENATRESPRKSRAHFQLAYAYFAEQRCGEAVAQYQQVERLEQPDYRLLVDWSEALDCDGKDDEAIDKLRRAAGLNRTAHVYALIGKDYAKQGKYAECREALDTAQQIDPNFEMTYVYRGNLNEILNDLEAAAREYRHALEINPNNAVAREGLDRVEIRLRSAR